MRKILAAALAAGALLAVSATAVDAKSSGMVKRYGASAADMRAAEAHRRLNPGDRY